MVAAALLILFGSTDAVRSTVRASLGIDRRSLAGAAASAVISPALSPLAARASEALTTPAVKLSPLPRVELGKLGIGAWAWGDSLFWGYNPLNDRELEEAFAFFQSRVGFIDTAELYGFGRSESLIGDFSKRTPNFKLPIATKFAALPWRTSRKDVVAACEASLKRLGKDRIELYQIHFPNAWANEAYWDGLADCVERGLVQSVGVSNYGVDAVKAVHAALAARGVELCSNQIQYSMLYRFPEENGLLSACKELDVDVLAYSPLALGLLTGKYTRENGQLPSGPRASIAKPYVADDRFAELQSLVARVAAQHDAEPAAVALNWCRAKGTIPIVGARTLKQAQQNVDSLRWDLTASELASLDAVARKLPWLGLEKPPFPEKDIITGLKMCDS